MTALAKEFFVSQTAISNSITRLEKELDVKLFERVGRNMILNKYGEAYLAHVESMLLMLEDANATIKRLKGTVQANVSLAMNSPVLWGDIVAKFISDNPGYTIALRECVIDSIQKQLPSLDVDLILAGKDDFTLDALDHIVFSRDRLWLCVPPGHWLAKRKSIKLAEAKNENFIEQPQHTGFSRFCKKVFSAAGFEPKIVAECNYEMRRELFRKNVGVLLASDSALRVNYYNYGANVLIEEPLIRREMALFWSKTRKLSPQAVAFNDMLLQVYRNDPLFH